MGDDRRRRRRGRGACGLRTPSSSTAAQFESAFAAKESAEKFKEQGGAIGFVAEQVQKLLDKVRDGKLEITALSQSLATLQMTPLTGSAENMMRQIADQQAELKAIADQAKGMEARGFVLPADLSGLVQQFKTMELDAKLSAAHVADDYVAELARIDTKLKSLDS